MIRMPLIILSFFCTMIFSSFAAAEPMRGESRVDGAAPHRARSFSSAPAKKKYTGLSDSMHAKFMQNEEYAAADAKLNATWAACKEWLSPGAYKKILAEQRAWLNGVRDAEAQAYMDDYPLPVAYARVISKRADKLAALISVPPRNGKYESDEGDFTASATPAGILVSGSSIFRDNTCSFEGHGIEKKGWITINQGDMDEFHVLFTQGGANIYYLPDAVTGCGMNAGFAGSYRYVGK